MDFSEEQIRRYARHIILTEVGGAGQARLLESRVLVVGAGGLGSALILYLAAAGVGTIGVIDDDDVELSNLQRQVIHNTTRLGQAKVDSAAETVAALNPDVRLIPIHARLNKDNARSIIRDYPVIADGCDNFPTRYLVNDACWLENKTLVSAAVLRFYGQLITFRRDAGPCYRCLHKAPPPPDSLPTCATAGVLGALPGTMGAMQATEVVKELLGIGRSMTGRLLVYDALDVSVQVIDVPANPSCPLCGTHPTITDLSAHSSTGQVCG